LFGFVCFAEHLAGVVYGERLPMGKIFAPLENDEEEEEMEEYLRNGNAALHHELVSTMVFNPSQCRLSVEMRDFRGDWEMNSVENSEESEKDLERRKHLDGVTLDGGNRGENESKNKQDLEASSTTATTVSENPLRKSANIIPICERENVCLTTDDFVTYTGEDTAYYFAIQKDGILALSCYPCRMNEYTDSRLLSGLWCSLWWKKSEYEMEGYWVKYRPGHGESLGVSPGKRWHWGRCWARRKK
jgi:hypothetical protein